MKGESGIITSRKSMKLWFPLCLIMVIISACSSSGGENSARENQADNTPPATADIVQEQQPFTRVPDRLFWKPPEGWVGDVMPFNNGDQIELFYLQDWRDGAPGFHPIFHATTSNLTDYAYHGEAIPFSEIGKQDLAIGTGSAIQVGDTYHFFYTGHNWMFPDEDKPKEAVMHAVSKDLKTWTKIPEDTFYAPEGYERHDFRDPFVIFNEEKQEYWMLVSARQEGVAGGVLALFTSKDLSHWEVGEPLQVEDTDKYFMLECADLFKMGDTWYMVFSEFSDKGATHYRMSESLDGPWIKPEQDLFDGKGFYAAKTGAIGDRRYLFGWVPTRQNEKDYMKWDWAGNMAVHQIVRNSDGTLSVKPPDEVESLFSEETSIRQMLVLGEASGEPEKLTINAQDGMSGIVFDQLPATAKITGTVTFDGDVSYTGFVAGVGEEAERAYGIRLEPGEQRLRYDAAPGKELRSLKPDLQVPAVLDAGKPYSFTIIIENDACSFYINGVSLTARIYKMPGQSWGWYSGGGTTTLENLKMFLPES